PRQNRRVWIKTRCAGRCSRLSCRNIWNTAPFGMFNPSCNFLPTIAIRSGISSSCGPESSRHCSMREQDRQVRFREHTLGSSTEDEFANTRMTESSHHQHVCANALCVSAKSFSDASAGDIDIVVGEGDLVFCQVPFELRDCVTLCTFLFIGNCKNPDAFGFRKKRHRGAKSARRSEAEIPCHHHRL